MKCSNIVLGELELRSLLGFMRTSVIDKNTLPIGETPGWLSEVNRLQMNGS